jgi:hypothetical protein
MYNTPPIGYFTAFLRRRPCLAPVASNFQEVFVATDKILLSQNEEDKGKKPKGPPTGGVGSTPHSQGNNFDVLPGSYNAVWRKNSLTKLCCTWLREGILSKKY